ncbi:diguanylate cyclase [Alkalilimnicola ehrlichii]|nr:diguanylate cyclase [Alkalilimnicola ehrlichii]
MLMVTVLFKPGLAASGNAYVKFSDIYYFVDERASLTAEEVKNLPPESWSRSRREVPNFGFVSNTYWFFAQASSLSPGDWLLEAGGPLLDNMEVFVYSGGKAVGHYEVGRMYPFANRELFHRKFLFPVELGEGNDLTILVRVQTTSALQVPLRLWRPSDWLQKSQHGMLLHGIFYGIIGAMALFNLLMWSILRERAYLFYVGIAISLGLFCATMSGLSYQFLWPNAPLWNAHAPAFLSFSCTIFASLFVIDAMRLRKTRPRYARVLQLVGAVAAMGLLSLPWLGPGFANVFAGFLSGVISAVVIFLILFALPMQRRYEYGFSVYAWGAVSIGVLLLVLNKFGALPQIPLTEYGLQLGVIAEAILLSAVLVRRYYSERVAKVRAEAKARDHERLARESQERLLAAQIEANEKLERRVAERTLELERAMQKVASTNETLKSMSLIDPLTGVGNRRFFDQSYRSEWRRAFREKSELALVFLDIDHYKLLLDQRGQDVADTCLKHIARTIEAVVSRPSDSIARFSEDIFALIMPQTSLAGAAHLAEEIRRQIEQAVLETERESVSVTVTAGVASIVPGERHHEAILLSFADDALHKAKADGRNRVRSFVLTPPRSRVGRFDGPEDKVTVTVDESRKLLSDQA